MGGREAEAPPLPRSTMPLSLGGGLFFHGLGAPWRYLGRLFHDLHNLPQRLLWSTKFSVCLSSSNMRHHVQGNLCKFYLELTGSTVLEKYRRTHGLRHIVNLMVDNITAVGVWGDGKLTQWDGESGGLGTQRPSTRPHPLSALPRTKTTHTMVLVGPTTATRIIAPSQAIAS